MRRILGLCILFLLVSANGEKKSKNKFADPILVKIGDLQDHRITEALYPFFKDKNALYRRDAVLAFASLQDTLAIDRLADVLLHDAEPKVRLVAAIALGQTTSEKSAQVLLQALTHERNATVLRNILEASGKTISKQDIDKLDIQVTTLEIQEGKAWAYYRLGLRGLADSTLTLKAVEFIHQKQTLQTRLVASNFFARGAQQVNLVEQELIESAQNDKSPLIRANVTAALRKIKTPASQNAIKKIFEKDADYRVRISAARSLQTFPISDVKSTLFAALKDPNVNVAIAASEVIINLVTEKEVVEITERATQTLHWRVRGNLYEAALKISASKETADAITQAYKNEKNPYGKAALLTALGRYVNAWDFINEQLHQSTVPVIKSSAAGALVSINKNKNFDKSLQSSYADVYKKAFATGDAAVIGTIATALMDTTLGYKKIITDITFLYDAKNKLSLPKDNEALQPLAAAIAYFEGREKADPVKNEFNHPIDWQLVKTIPRDQKVLIKTDKGDVVLRLLVEEAPGSVANFVQLVNSKYFDAKNFHRVVPNFVIQGGCNRGDGWGSEDYSIRSEYTDRHYTEGSVGMASAGKDTEGTQWFITHSPTPHLDGRYSIFAITESGMDVVHQIEVGDKILSVTLIK